MFEHYVLRMGGNILRCYDDVKKYAKSFFPSQIVCVSLHINKLTDKVYQSTSLFPGWANSFCSNMYLPYVKEGYYRIDVWNSNVSSNQHYYLSVKQLEKALGLRYLSSWWAMTDFGIITMLSSYVSMMQMNKNCILGITIDGKDVTHILKPYLISLSLKGNCTARSVCSLYCELSDIDPKKMDTDEVIFIDYDMIEHKKTNDELLFE